MVEWYDVLVKLNEQRNSNENLYDLCNLLNDKLRTEEYDSPYEMLQEEFTRCKNRIFVYEDDLFKDKLEM